MRWLNKMNNLQKYMMCEVCSFVYSILYLVVVMITVVSGIYLLFLLGSIMILFIIVFNILKVIFAYKIAIKRQ